MTPPPTGVGRPDSWADLGLATRAVRVGQSVDASDQHSEGLTLTSSYEFADAHDAAEKFAGRRPGNVYVRFTNPTVSAFEQRMAALEDTEVAVATASGMAAYSALVLAYLAQGDEVVLARGVFGTTTRLFQDLAARFGLRCHLFDAGSTAQAAALVGTRTRLVVVESPTNPTMTVADIGAIAAVAHRHGALLVVDNTLCTPVLQRPHRHGADLVLHSAGKYLDGQGRCCGGVITGREETVSPLRDVLRTAGPSLSPFNAWLLLKSLETLPLRMERHDRNAAVVAGWLREHPRVREVLHTSCAAHPQRELIDRQQSGHGGLLSFRIDGGREEAFRIVDATDLISTTTNIGDTKTMLTHPASTTHGRMDLAERDRAGIGEDLLRLSVGFEEPGDVLHDLDRALRAVRPAVGGPATARPTGSR